MSSDLESRPLADVDCEHGVLSQLLLECGHGDSSSFAAIYDLFSPLVIAQTRSRVAAEDVETAVAQAFVAVWCDSPTYRPADSTAVAWVLSRVVVRDPPA